jgi:hypothetical protein
VIDVDETVVTHERRMQEVKDREAFKREVSLMGVRRVEAESLVRVTKQLVFEGILHREQVLVPELGPGAYLTIRPITDLEFVKVQQSILGDMKRTQISQIDMTAKDMVDRERRGKYLAVSLGLSCDDDEWSPDDVGQLPPGVPDRLYNHLAVISGFPRLAGTAIPEEPEDPGDGTT